MEHSNLGIEVCLLYGVKLLSLFTIKVVWVDGEFPVDVIHVCKPELVVLLVWVEIFILFQIFLVEVVDWYDVGICFDPGMCKLDAM